VRLEARWQFSEIRVSSLRLLGRATRPSATESHYAVDDGHEVDESRAAFQGDTVSTDAAAHTSKATAFARTIASPPAATHVVLWPRVPYFCGLLRWLFT
jgi:hypothetical protein